MKKIISLFAIGALMIGGITPAFASGNSYNVTNCGAYNGVYTLAGVLDYPPHDIYKLDTTKSIFYTDNGYWNIGNVTGLEYSGFSLNSTAVGGYGVTDFPFIGSYGACNVALYVAPVVSNTSVFKDVRMIDFATNTASAVSGTAGNLVPVIGLAVALPLVFWVIYKTTETVDPENVFLKGKKKHGRK